MPRKTDPKLSARILSAAHGLWASGGEEALTMRAVAAAAKTTTPTVYAHFVDRKGLLQALRKRAASRLEEALRHTDSFADGCRRYLAFSEKHPNDYALLFGTGWRGRTSEAGSEAGPLTILKNALAETVGGTPESNLRLATSVLLILHGAANLIATGGSTSKKSTLPDLNKTCIDACNALVEHARSNRDGGSSKSSESSGRAKSARSKG